MSPGTTTSARTSPAVAACCGTGSPPHWPRSPCLPLCLCRRPPTGPPSWPSTSPARSSPSSPRRRRAAEAPPGCAECGHPHAAHREGDDPVTPGTCSACSDSDCDHDYTAAAGAQPTAEHHTVGGIRYLCHADDHYCPHQGAAGAQPTTKPETNLADRLEAVLTERFTELGNPFSRMSYHEKGPDGWPASHPVGPHHVAEVLRELLAAGARQDGTQR
jgi:hypothetical protein